MKNFNKELIEQIKAEIERTGLNPGSVEDLNKIAGDVMETYNDSGLDDFEGLSPKQMYVLMHEPLRAGCPVMFKPIIAGELLSSVPIIKACNVLISELKTVKEIKLTAKGNLPQRIVTGIYELNIRYSRFDYAPRLEQDNVPAAYSRALLKLAGIVKIQKNKLSLTKYGMGMDPESLYRSLFSAYIEKFHKGYLDGYESGNTGNIASLYILYLLNRYGNEPREATFYSSLYFKAFPELINEFNEMSFRTREETAADCYSYRIFNKGLNLFGLVDLQYKDPDTREKKLYIMPTPLLQSIFEFILPSTPYTSR